MIQFSVDI